MVDKTIDRKLLMFNPEILLTLTLNQQLFADPRRIALLKAIAQTGSLSQAAKVIGISYKTAWDSINEINQLAIKPFVISVAGGKGGGGAKLSAYAIRFIQLYELLTQMQSRSFNILNDETVPIDNILATTAKLSLQSSARNQLSGAIQSIDIDRVAGSVAVLLDDQQTVIEVSITHSSIRRLQLIAGKAVMIFIKAPQVELTDTMMHNGYRVEVKKMIQDDNWCELELLLPSGTRLFAIKPTVEVCSLSLIDGQFINISINPENIILATLT